MITPPKDGDWALVIDSPRFPMVRFSDDKGFLVGLADNLIGESWVRSCAVVSRGSLLQAKRRVYGERATRRG